jgi:two-component system response regulator CpxR
MPNPPTSKTILCIDDDDGVLEYQKALLERRGYAVLTASSPQQGLQIAAESGVAAVIVDYHMPEINGHEVALEIRRINPDIPIVMVSSEAEIPSHVLDVVDAFVPKDQTPTRLVPVLTRICDEVLAKLAERARVSA